MTKRITEKLIDKLSYEIVGAATEVHKLLGVGLLESQYEKALLYELKLRGLKMKNSKFIISQFQKTFVNEYFAALPDE